MRQPIKLVFVSCPNKESALSLAKLVVEHRLAACAQVVPHIESFYFWEGKIENSHETLLLLKTSKRLLLTLQEFILKHHPYQTAEFLALDISHASTSYHKWLLTELNTPFSHFLSKFSKPRIKKS